MKLYLIKIIYLTMCEISIIIPVYNAGKYLSQCLYSILQQSYKDYEVILVNDGSSDNSEDICLSYVKQDGRFKYYNQENKGASAARNLGIDKSCGKYIVFIDADDYIIRDYLEILAKAVPIDRQNVFLLVEAPMKIDMNGNVTTAELSNEVFNGNRGKREYVLRGYLTMSEPHSKMFSSSLIKEKGICFPENVKIGEDGIFIGNYLKYVAVIKVIAHHGYCYRFSPTSVQRKIYDTNIELAGFNLWKKCLVDLCAMLSLPVDNKYIWNVLSIPMQRYIKSVCYNKELSYMDKVGYIKSLEKLDTDNYGKGRHYSFFGKISKFLINHRLLIFMPFIYKK